MDRSPFHAGEQALQAQAGVRQRIEQIGRAIIRDHMPDQHRELFGKLPTLLLGALDASGQPWATMLHGAPGFVSSPDARTLRVQALPAPGDPVAALLHDGAAVGLLGLEPHTRRRNRMNGRVQALGASGFEVGVRQSFGNCPKYIVGRQPEAVPGRSAAPARALAADLDDEALALLRRADTLFIASASRAMPEAADGDGVDVSHRGGPPGFVQISRGPDGRGWRLTLPDYLGNNLFNTLGNLLAWPHAGLLVVDPDRGDTLHLAAGATIEVDATGRRLHLDVQHGWWRAAALPLRWSAPQAPPQFTLQPPPPA
jgi:hypothetical protein